MTTITAIIIGVFGAAIGSFLSVTIHRLKKDQKGILLGRSMCPYCKKNLKWTHLIPVFSFLFLRGKCAYCGKKIGYHYLFIEILTATLFVLAFLNWNFLETAASTIDPSILSYSINYKTLEVFTFYILEITLMMGMFFYDLRFKEIPDKFSLPAIVLGVIGTLTFTPSNITSIGIALLIIAIFFGGQIVLSKGRWLGGGDLRVGALMAILLGVKLMLLALILSYVIGAFISIFLLISGKATRKTAIPFGPFLITGTLISVFVGTDILTAYFKLLGI